MNLFNYESIITSEKVFGLEITDGKLKILKLSMRRGKLSIEGFDEEIIAVGSVKNGVILNTDNVAETLKILRDRTKPQKIKDRYAAVVLPDDKVFIRVVNFPSKLSKQEIGESVEFKAKDLIAMPLDKVYWDWHRFPHEAGGDQIEVVVSAADKACVDSYVNMLAKLEIVPLFFDISGNAAVRYLFKSDPARRALLVRIDKSSSTLSLYLGGGVRYQSIVEEGYGSIIEDLSVVTKEDKSIIEKKSLEDGSSDYDENLKNILPNSFLTLSKEITKTLEYYLQTYKNVNPKSSNPIEIFIFGKGAALFQKRNLISRDPLTLENINEKEVQDDKSSQLREQYLPSNIVLVGASLRNLGQFKKQKDINLTPDTIKSKYLQNVVYRTLFLYARMILWGLGIIFLFAFLSLVYLQLYKSTVDSRLTSLKKYTESGVNKDFEQEVTSLNTNVTQLSNLYMKQVDWDLYFDKLNEIKPDGVRLTNLYITDDSSLFKTIVKDKNVLNKSGVFFTNISGTAVSRSALQEFENEMSSSDFFEDVIIPISNYEQESDISFSIYAVISNDSLLVKEE